ncbi:MAG: hypothetical protein H0U74_18745 [Bradymonadaceae bacterium]|nr:hypothetical protein [Lujinxingiaceae bacterium]
MPLFRLTDNRLHRFQNAHFGDENHERRLEDILVNSGAQFGVVWISRQGRTTRGKRPDLLGLAADGTLEVWELKRGRAPRDILAQAMEYAAWASNLREDALEEMAAEFPETQSTLAERLSDAFAPTLGCWNPPRINTRQRIVLVAQDFEPELIEACQWLALHDVALVCWRFSYHHEVGGQELLNFECVLEAGAPVMTAKSRSVYPELRGCERAVGLADGSLEGLLDRFRARLLKADWSHVYAAIAWPSSLLAPYIREGKSGRSTDGRIGIDIIQGWKPGLFVGVIADGRDHRVTPSNPELGADFALVLSVRKVGSPEAPAVVGVAGEGGRLNIFFRFRLD